MAYILAIYLAYILLIFLIYNLAFHLVAEVQLCPLSSEDPRLRSSSTHWARKVPDWGPVVSSILRTLRLRSNRAHSDRKPAVEVSSVHYARKLAKSEERRVGKVEIDVEIEEERGGGRKKRKKKKRSKRNQNNYNKFNNFYKFQFY